MPINLYYHGNGERVLKNMTDEYGPDKGKQVFYALANKKHEKPEKPKGNYDLSRK